jgi:hypothetical protein
MGDENEEQQIRQREKITERLRKREKERGKKG